MRKGPSFYQISLPNNLYFPVIHTIGKSKKTWKKGGVAANTREEKEEERFSFFNERGCQEQEILKKKFMHDSQRTYIFRLKCESRNLEKRSD